MILLFRVKSICPISGLLEQARFIHEVNGESHFCFESKIATFDTKKQSNSGKQNRNLLLGNSNIRIDFN